jgi:hypothetical protein
MHIPKPYATAVSHIRVGAALEGHWTLDAKPRFTTHFVEPALPADSPEVGLMNPANGQTLIWVWSLHSEFATEACEERDVHERFHLALEGGPHSSSERASLLTCS